MRHSNDSGQTHVVISVPLFDRQCDFIHCTDLTKVPFADILVIPDRSSESYGAKRRSHEQEINRADAVWQQVEHSHGHKPAVEAITLVVRANLAPRTVSYEFVLRDPGAQEIFEPVSGNSRRRFLMYRLLVVLEQRIPVKRLSEAS